MKPYDTYKDSGIEWIGEIPSHWDSTKLKFLGESIIGIIYSPDDVVNEGEGILVLRSSNIQDGKLAFEDNVFVNKTIKEKYLTKEGDILVCARNGSAHLVGKSAFISKEYAGLTFGAFMSIVRSDLDKFLYYFFNSQIFKAQTGLFSTSTINQLTSDTLNNMFISVPSEKKEQTSIAYYLDRKTAEIDTLIADKKRLLELYEEEKTAVINQAVTKGVDPKAKMKDSGVEWLGEIPEYWDVKKLKHVVSKKLMYGANESAEEENRDNPRYIRITDFGNDGKLKEDTFKSLPLEKANDYILEEGDILFARSGATVGKTFQFKNYKGKACFAGYLIKATPNRKIVEPDFLYNYTKSGAYENWKRSIFNQATIQNIGADKYAFLEIPIPPNIKQQQSIVRHIETECTRIDAKIAKTQKLIELLTEYRTALISEVVTGKIKVTD